MKIEISENEFKSMMQVHTYVDDNLALDDSKYTKKMEAWLSIFEDVLQKCIEELNVRSESEVSDV